MVSKRTEHLIELLFILPWWVSAVFADAAFFSPDIAKQFYPPIKSPEGLPLYHDIVIIADTLSPYLTALFVAFSLLSLVRETLIVRKRAEHSARKGAESNKK